jgi:hypothetical protein
LWNEQWLKFIASWMFWSCLGYWLEENHKWKGLCLRSLVCWLLRWECLTLHRTIAVATASKPALPATLPIP